MLSFEQLDEAARTIDPRRGDIYQDAWVKYLTEPPQHFGTAVNYAKQARIDAWRKEHNELRLIEDIDSGGADPTANAALARIELAKIPPEMIALALSDDRSPSTRSKLFRWREKLGLPPRRSRSPATDTHCARGHRWTAETIYINGGRRQCVICRRRIAQDHYFKMKKKYA